MTLLDQLNQENIKKNAPLAERMRARTLDEFYGQEHLLGPGRLLRRAVDQAAEDRRQERRCLQIASKLAVCTGQ